MSDSYLEKCIHSLPPEKQNAAREAFKAIAENGDDSLLSKLIVTLEATSAYASTIPKELAANGDKFIKELEARLHKAALAQVDLEAARDDRLKEHLTKLVPQLGKTFALDRVVATLQTQAAELGRMERSLVRLRQVRIAGFVALISLGAILGSSSVVGIFWSRYHDALDAQHFVYRMNAVGVHASIQRIDSGELFTIEGPEILRRTGWKKDARGNIIGAEITYPAAEESR